MDSDPGAGLDITAGLLIVGLVVAAVAAAIFGYVAVLLWKRRWLIRDLPTSDAAHVFVGMNEVVGRAEHLSDDSFLIAPYSAAECVWYRSRLEREEQNDDAKSWKTVSDTTSGRPFWIADESGKVLVNPRGATVETRRRHRDTHLGRPQTYSRAALDATMERARKRDEERERRRLGVGSGFTSARSGPRPRDAVGFGRPMETGLGLGGSYDSGSGSYRTTEWYLEPGDDLYLLGHATLRSDSIELEFGATNPRTGQLQGSLLLSDASEDTTARQAAVGAVLALLATMAAAAAVPALWFAFQTASGDGPFPGDPSLIDQTLRWSAGLALGVPLAFAVSYPFRVFNRLVAVREQAETAWSLIDVQLRKRHDLLPQLAAVAAGAAGHERKVLEGLARLRSGRELPGVASKLPDERQIEATSAVDRDDRRRARTIIGLVERYPSLKTDRNFRLLARQIIDAENGVAFARSFYNDAITVLDDRRQTFPGVLVAPLVPVPTRTLFEASEPDRRPAANPRAPAVESMESDDPIDSAGAI